MPRELDIDEVMPRLYQGGQPDPTRSYHPFSMLVLCAREVQPDMPRFRGQIVRAAFDDTKAREQMGAINMRAHTAALFVAKAWEEKGRILVTCQMGWNRSGLVVGMAMCRLTRLAPDRIIAAIRRARGDDALCNEMFAEMIHRYHAQVRTPRPAPRARRDSHA